MKLRYIIPWAIVLSIVFLFLGLFLQSPIMSFFGGASMVIFNLIESMCKDSEDINKKAKGIKNSAKDLDSIADDLELKSNNLTGGIDEARKNAANSSLDDSINRANERYRNK